MAFTREELNQINQNTVLSEAPELAPSFITGQDLFFKQQMISAIGATISREIEAQQNNIYPYSASGTSLLKHATALNMPLFNGATPTYITFKLFTNNPTDVAPSNYIIPANTKLKDALTGIQYYTINPINITSGVLITSIVGSCYSVNSGKNTYSGYNSLSFTPTIPIGSITITGATPTNIVSGQNMPTDRDISAKIIQWGAYRVGGGSIADYLAWTQASNPEFITGATALQPVASTAYVVAWGGSRDPNLNINLSFPVSNVLDISVVDNAYSYINLDKRPLGGNCVIYSANTYGISATTENLFQGGAGLLNANITISIILQSGLSLSSIITGTDGNSFTVTQWVQRMTRYAVLNTPQFGTPKNGNYYILGSDIIEIVKSSLGNDGYLCSILLDATVKYTDVNIPIPIGDIIVPQSGQYEVPTANPPEILCFYDVESSFINVVSS